MQSSTCTTRKGILREVTVYLNGNIIAFFYCALVVPFLVTILNLDLAYTATFPVIQGLGRRVE